MYTHTHTHTSKRTHTVDQYSPLINGPANRHLFTVLHSVLLEGPAQLLELAVVVATIIQLINHMISRTLCAACAIARDECAYRMCACVGVRVQSQSSLAKLLFMVINAFPERPLP